MTETTPYKRTFYVFWFGLFTVLSVVLNGAHAALFAPRAWHQLDKTVTDWLGTTMPPWFAILAVGIAVIPPVGLACATHALVTPDPNTTSGRGTGARTTTWTIALAALTLSTVMITDLVRMVLGVDWRMAVLIPLVVDVSIVAAVLRLEIRRVGHAVEAHVKPATPEPEVHEPESTTPAVEVREPAHEPEPIESTTRVRDPKPAVREPRAVTRVRELDPVDYEPAAARLVESGKTTLEAETIVKLMTLRKEIGITNAAKELGVSLSTAKRTATNVKELAAGTAPEADTAGMEADRLTLTAVG